MADMTNIFDFNNSDGLPPGVVQKLNNNFWAIVQKILSPEVVVVSGETAPEPRTDETLWYQPSTGNLYIWREFNNEWSWGKIDTGYIHIDPDPPNIAASRATNPYTRENEFLWIDQSNNANNPLYLWVGNDVEGYAWWNIRDVIYWVMSNLLPSEWLAMGGFTTAVETVVNNM